MLTIVGIFIAGFSSILTGLNFIVTIHTMRAPGLTWFRLPLFIWSHYATAIIQVLGTPVVAITLALVAIERIWRVGIFDPSLGGDPDSLSAFVLVLFASGRLHHGASRNGCCQRTCHDARTAPHFRILHSSRFRASQSPLSASSFGDTTCLCRDSRNTPA